jgi:hypothetical protein
MAFDDLDDPPSGSFWQKWFGGIVVPIVTAWYCIDCIATQEATWSGRFSLPRFSFPSEQLQGFNACLLGVVVLAGGLFAHFHYFWGLVDRLEPYSVAGKIAALLLLLASLFLLIVRVGVFG